MSGPAERRRRDCVRAARRQARPTPIDRALITLAFAALLAFTFGLIG